ncbi:hypothetical protein HMPREF2822_10275 [Corynebacterium sp. HMSC062E11]|uniref:hypothetical protein n=1 Tax=Corynebacterium TaxID=1716 RepID=UPI0008A4B8D4|nr:MULTISPECIES: hypothetical protein [Corynebacterium]MCG7260226.1 hypothetical protein [Corynebacterium aurimucosum]MCZ9297755.1 hypothetical protein [Corynebacterium hesseae]MDK6807172.1 hypothetical protein [Corynebacterium aurimucosum]MDK8898051.1 hypothetical protein [Corynebacterium sp. MSK004]NJJ83126.1 hypothetical protein [Corynebacterium aurimucosum]
MSHNSTTNQNASVGSDPFDIMSGSPLPAVSRDRVLTALNSTELDMAATAHPEDATAAVARLNDLDWVITVEEGLVRIECVLSTQLNADMLPIFHVLCNEFNAGAFDGRALVGLVEDEVELRGDACFVTTAGLNEDQLFHALNVGVINAQEALLSVLDTFNAAARELARDVDDAESD